MNLTHFHRRNLPHFYRNNTTFFITYRLKDSIPIKALKELRGKKEFTEISKTKKEKYLKDKKFFAEYDKLLDNNRKIQYLKNEKIAKIVQQSLHFYDKKDFKLICYTIMPNHVHLVFYLFDNLRTVDKIMQSIKRYSARESNKILKRKGSFWQSESFDHIVRDEDELEKIIKYVLYNPVKAKLVNDWKDWKFTYLAE